MQETWAQVLALPKAPCRSSLLFLHAAGHLPITGLSLGCSDQLLEFKTLK